MSTDDIARRLGTTRQNVEQLLKRGMRKLGNSEELRDLVSV